jgi:shikimate kinase
VNPDESAARIAAGSVPSSCSNLRRSSSVLSPRRRSKKAAEERRVRVGTKRSMGAMKRVLITGLSGVGKSTVTAALAARGYRAIDIGEPEWSEYADSDDPTSSEPGRDWVFREDRVAELLARDDGDVLFVSGTAANQQKFYPRFDHIVLLSAPASVMRDRMRTRSTNEYGKDPQEQDRAISLKATVEPLLRRGADLEIDTSLPVDAVVERIVALVED